MARFDQGFGGGGAPSSIETPAMIESFVSPLSGDDTVRAHLEDDEGGGGGGGDASLDGQRPSSRLGLQREHKQSRGRQQRDYPVQSARRRGDGGRDSILSVPSLQEEGSDIYSERRGGDGSGNKKMEVGRYANPKHFNAYTGGALDAPADEIGGGSGIGGNSNGNSAADGKHKNKVDSPDATATGGAAIDPIDAERHAEATRRLSQYTRGSDRRQVLRTLGDPKLMPRAVRLRSVWMEDIAAAEREAAAERAALNGVKFLQVPKHTNGEGETTAMIPWRGAFVCCFWLQ